MQACSDHKEPWDERAPVEAAQRDNQRIGRGGISGHGAAPEASEEGRIIGDQQQPGSCPEWSEALRAPYGSVKSTFIWVFTSTG